MGFDPISLSVMVAQAAQAAAASAVSDLALVASDTAMFGKGLLSAGAAAGGAKAGAGESAFSATAGQPAFTATAQREGLAAAANAAKGVAGAAAGNPAVQAATTAGATAGVQKALSDSETIKPAKVQTPGAADASAGLAADRERLRRKPGRGASILTSPLGLSSQGRRTSPGVATLTGTLG